MNNEVIILLEIKSDTEGQLRYDSAHVSYSETEGSRVGARGWAEGKTGSNCSGDRVSVFCKMKNVL